MIDNRVKQVLQLFKSKISVAWMGHAAAAKVLAGAAITTFAVTILNHADSKTVVAKTPPPKPAFAVQIVAVPHVTIDSCIENEAIVNTEIVELTKQKNTVQIIETPVHEAETPESAVVVNATVQPTAATDEMPPRAYRSLLLRNRTHGQHGFNKCF